MNRIQIRDMQNWNNITKRYGAEETQMHNGTQNQTNKDTHSANAAAAAAAMSFGFGLISLSLLLFALLRPMGGVALS